MATRQQCGETARELARVAQNLTNDYVAAMHGISDMCADRELTPDQLAKCKNQMAQASQEYIAQCASFASSIDLQYGAKTMKGKLEQARKVGANFMGQLKSIFPGAQNAENLRAMEQMIESFVPRCASGERFRLPEGITCDQLMGASAAERKAIAEALTQGSA